VSHRIGSPVSRAGTALPAVALLVSLGACADAGREEAELAPGMSVDALAEDVQKFSPTTLSFDTTLLDDRQKKLVRKLVEASDQMDAIFLKQVWRGNPAMATRVAGMEGSASQQFFDIMYGPWNRLDENEPFLDVGPKPPGAGYYPPDLTKQEFEAWIAAHPEDEDAFTSGYTVIRRDGDSLVAVPYSVEYESELSEAARLMREAAELADNESLRLFLEKRADALLSDDYFESEVAWMRLEDNLVDPTMGPYEVYEDELMGIKTAFESFITLRDPVESERLASLEAHLPDLERALPIPDEYKYLDRPFTSPISVVTEIYTAGDTRSGVQTIAFNLPNDERVREEEGSKKVMLRNVIDAKFEKILRPIAQTVMVNEQADRLTVDPYFTRVLMHELAHGLGPDYVTGQEGVTVRSMLQERYSALEEAKADVVGTHSLAVLTEQGVYTAEFLEEVYIDHVADMFRCVRFGVGEAHGKGCLLQFNYLWENGAIVYDVDSGLFAASLEKMPAGIAGLANQLLLIQATGDYEGAGALMEKYGQVRPEMETALERLAIVPVDIKPEYAVKDMMVEW
jgi:hypothetical protein